MAHRFTRWIPNTITCFNLFSGCIAVVMAFEARYELAFCFILLSALFDFFDGMMARLLNAPSPIGKELDSLADVISFGLAPSLIIYALCREMYYPVWLEGVAPFFPYIAFLIPIFSALRLAKFNNDMRQKNSFIGLPVPANAIFWGSFIAGSHNFIVGERFHPLYLLILIFFSSWLLVSEIPLFSLKFKNFTWRENRKSYIFLLICLPLLFFLRVSGFAAIIGWYILLSLVTRNEK